MSDLKPCPFCGGVPVWGIGCHVDNTPYAYRVECQKCKYVITPFYQTREEAIEAWNRRYERTAKAEYSEPDGCYLCGECGYVIEIEDVYCAGCGARLDWGGQ